MHTLPLVSCTSVTASVTCTAAKIFSAVCLLLCLCDMHGASRGNRSQAVQELRSINLSHPLILSYAMGQLRNNIVNEFEVGLAGAKVGMGFGTMSNQSLMTIKGVVMYTWDSSFNEDFDAPFIEQVPFPTDKFYYGGEAVMSNQGYRFSLSAFRIYDPDENDTNETLYGASIGLGW